MEMTTYFASLTNAHFKLFMTETTFIYTEASYYHIYLIEQYSSFLYKIPDPPRESLYTLHSLHSTLSTLFQQQAQNIAPYQTTPHILPFMSLFSLLPSLPSSLLLPTPPFIKSTRYSSPIRILSSTVDSIMLAVYY